jgi:hypothetical protein
MGAAVRLSCGLIRWRVTCVQSFLPGLHQRRISGTGLNPESEHLQSPWRRLILQEAFLTTMSRATGETIATH